MFRIGSDNSFASSETKTEPALEFIALRFTRHRWAYRAGRNLHLRASRSMIRRNPNSRLNL